MWKSRPKSKSSRETDNNIDGRLSPNLNFIHSSLKDVVNLLSDDVTNTFTKTLAHPSPSPPSTRRLSIFHRVHLANKFARAFSSNLSPTFTKSLPDSSYTKTILTKSFIPLTQDIKLINSSNSIHSDPQISIPEPQNSPADNKLTFFFNSIQSDCQISVPEAEKSAADNKLTKIFNSRQSNHHIFIPGAENRIILYTTSLRVVRRTFEACRTVKSILRAFRVSMEERDVSMDSRFLTELHNMMKESGEVNVEHKLELPMVFIGGKYIGGAEEVKELHETGELNKCLERLPAVTGGVCEVCGDYRFVVCDECSGSRKCYSDKGGFRSCMLCNENGLVRCPLCLAC